MCTCGGQAQKLLGTAPLPGQRVPGEEGGPTGGQGWRSPSPPRRERRASAPPEDETPESPVTGEEGEIKVEVQPGVEAGRGEMAEQALGGARMIFSFLLFSSSLSFSLFCLAVWGTETGVPY